MRLVAGVTVGQGIGVPRVVSMAHVVEVADLVASHVSVEDLEVGSEPEFEQRAGIEGQVRVGRLELILVADGVARVLLRHATGLDGSLHVFNGEVAVWQGVIDRVCHGAGGLQACARVGVGRFVDGLVEPLEAALDAVMKIAGEVRAQIGKVSAGRNGVVVRLVGGESAERQGEQRERQAGQKMRMGVRTLHARIFILGSRD